MAKGWNAPKEGKFNSAVGGGMKNREREIPSYEEGIPEQPATR